MGKFNIFNTLTGEWMLGESCSESTAKAYCDRHYKTKYGDHFEVRSVDFDYAEWLPMELRSW